MSLESESQAQVLKYAEEIRNIAAKDDTPSLSYSIAVLFSASAAMSFLSKFANKEKIPSKDRSFHEQLQIDAKRLKSLASMLFEQLDEE